MSLVAAAFEPTNGKIEFFLSRAIVTDCEVLYAVSDEDPAWSKRLPRAMQVDADMIAFVDAVFVNTEKILHHIVEIDSLISRCRPKFVILHPNHEAFQMIPSIISMEYLSLWNYNGWKNVLCLQ
jgi:hypothetical protein